MKGNEIMEYIVRGDMPDLEEIRESCHRQAANQPHRSRGGARALKLPNRKPLLASIAVALCLAFAAPAFAVQFPAAYDLLYSIAPSVAQFYKPVQKSDEDNGIRMQVIAAYIHEGTAEIFVGVQDLTGNRVDETTDLFDSYSINCPFDNYASCTLVDYNESTSTARFLISISTMNGEKITGDKVTFTVRELLSGKNVYDGVPITVDKGNISNNPGTMPLPTENGGGSGGDVSFMDEDPMVLAPCAPIDFGVDGIGITGMGYIDGMLHIQTFLGNIGENDNHGYVYFKGKGGSEIQCLYNLAFNTYQNGEMVRYEEFVFDIPQSQLDKYELDGYFVCGAELTKGYWQVTFPLSSS